MRAHGPSFSPRKELKMAKRGLPEDWQSKVQEALTKLENERPEEEVFGLSLPEPWKYELELYVRNGDLRRLFKIRAVSFAGSSITRLENPCG